jgi:hypothetical protein
MQGIRNPGEWAYIGVRPDTKDEDNPAKRGTSGHFSSALSQIAFFPDLQLSKILPKITESDPARGDIIKTDSKTKHQDPPRS